MARNFELDTKAAMDSNNGGKRIKDPGVYTGKIVCAWYEANANGTEIVQIVFKSDSGQEAGPLALYTHKSNGEVLSGYNTLNAILTCTKLRGITTKPKEVELYDFDTKSTIHKMKDVYVELTDKPIGFVFRAEEYETRNRDIKERLVIVAPFCPKTKLMADEILKKELSPKSLDRITAWVEKEPIKRFKNRPVDAYQALANDPLPDDEIPF